MQGHSRNAAHGFPRAISFDFHDNAEDSSHSLLIVPAAFLRLPVDVLIQNCTNIHHLHYNMGGCVFIDYFNRKPVQHLVRRVFTFLQRNVLYPYPFPEFIDIGSADRDLRRTAFHLQSHGGIDHGTDRNDMLRIDQESPVTAEPAVG